MKKIILLIILAAALLLVYLFNSSKKVSNKDKKKQVGIDNQFKSSTYKKIRQLRETKRELKLLPEIKDKSTTIFYSAMKAYPSDEYPKLLREAINLNPSNTKALGRLSEYLLSKKEIKESRKMARECLAINPKSKICHRSLISSFTRFGEFEESYLYLKDCLIETPDNIHCHSGLFTYYLANDELINAEEHLNKMKEIEPNSLWTIIARANFADTRGNTQEAIILYSQACESKNPYACKMKKHLESK